VKIGSIDAIAATRGSPQFPVTFNCNRAGLSRNLNVDSGDRADWRHGDGDEGPRSWLVPVRPLLCAWIGLTPKDHSTAGKTRIGKITRAGDEMLRSVLVAGATPCAYAPKETAPASGEDPGGRLLPGQSGIRQRRYKPLPPVPDFRNWPVSTPSGLS
jgi:hypothetical protein